MCVCVYLQYVCAYLQITLLPSSHHGCAMPNSSVNRMPATASIAHLQTVEQIVNICFRTAVTGKLPHCSEQLLAQKGGILVDVVAPAVGELSLLEPLEPWLGGSQPQRVEAEVRNM